MLKFDSPLIEYDVAKTIEKIGAYPIHVYAMRDLDRALDDICKKYPTNNSDEEEQLFRVCPYFGVVWPSARALALFMSERKKLFTKKKGIEVGCGLGIPSILAKKLGAQVTASDFHPDVKDWIQKNAELNHVQLDYVEWDWGNTKPPKEIEMGAYDFVLASDVLYEKQHPEELVQALVKLVKPDGSIYLSDPGRAYLDTALKEFEKCGFHRITFEFKTEESSSRPEMRLEKKRSVQVFQFIREP